MVIGSFLGLALAAMAAAVPPGQMPGVADLGSTVDLSDTFTRWSIQRLDLPREGGAGFEVDVTLDGGSYRLILDSFSLRTDNFAAYIERNGELIRQEVAAPRTYRGVVDGVPNSVVAGSLIEGQLKVLIDLDFIGEFGIQPLSDFIPGADPKLHVMYNVLDGIWDPNWSCGTDGIFHGFGDPQDPNDPGVDPAADKTAETAFDTDYEYFTRRGSNIQACVDDIENIMVGVDVIYQRDVAICHKINQIVVRDNANDPYSGTDAESILSQFQNHWNANYGNVQRDMAHMMAGRSTDGGIIGIAYLAVVCSRSSAYAVSWTLFTSNLSYRVALTAHEKGHNWGAGHCCSGCSGCSDCRIMCPCLGGCSGDVTRFGTNEKSAISNFRNSRSCLTDGCNGGGGGGGEVPCSVIKKLTLKCTAARDLKGKVVLYSYSYHGKHVSVSIDGGASMQLTINERKAAFFKQGPFTGTHSVTLTDPANCKTTTTTCP